MPYIIQSGDTLNKIASMYGVSLEAIFAANPGKWPNPNLIYPGQVVVLPSETNYEYTDSVQNPAPPKPSVPGVYYTPETPESERNITEVPEDKQVDPNDPTLPKPPPKPSLPAEVRQRVLERVRSQYDVALSDDEVLFWIQQKYGSVDTWGDGTFDIDGAWFPSGTATEKPQPPVTEPPPSNDPGDLPPPEQEGPPAEDPLGEYEKLSAKGYIEAVLARYDLMELADWAWKQIQEFIPPDMILLNIRETDAWKRRFPAMDMRKAAGMNAVSPEEYINLENQYLRLMRAAGLPDQFWDSRSDFTQFIANDVSPAEVSARIDEGYRRVAQTAPEVRAAYAEFYGIAGDAALAAMFLDPDRASNVLVEQARTAEVAGLADRAGVDIGKAQATEIAQTAPTVGQIQAGIGQISSQADLARETFSEVFDLQTGDLVAAAFNTSGATEARREIRRRRNQRLAQFSGGGGAAFFAGQGFVGLGVAGD